MVACSARERISRRDSRAPSRSLSLSIATSESQDIYGKRSWKRARNNLLLGRMLTHVHRGGVAALAFHHCRKPIIGAIQGAAVGVGITMTLPFSIRVAYRHAKIGFVFGRRGLAMEACSSFFLPRLIGYSRALHLVTTGGVYEAGSNLMDGLFTELVDRPDEVLKKALEIAQVIASNMSPTSAFLMKEMMWRD
ncbi:hypothetical protein MRB53_040345 [Persea americana]|nr:hypothetical protein MRB53_040345 [Persea americana]